jgi:hypothetical protein
MQRRRFATTDELVRVLGAAEGVTEDEVRRVLGALEGHGVDTGALVKITTEATEESP